MTDVDRPDWQERLKDTLGDTTIPRYLIQARVDDAYRPLIMRAARKRGLRPSAYVRRAVMAFVAHDLDIDFLELSQDEPPIEDRDGLPPRRFRGKGFGPWRIRRLDHD